MAYTEGSTTRSIAGYSGVLPKAANGSRVVPRLVPGSTMSTVELGPNQTNRITLPRTGKSINLRLDIYCAVGRLFLDSR